MLREEKRRYLIRQGHKAIVDRPVGSGALHVVEWLADKVLDVEEALMEERVECWVDHGRTTSRLDEARERVVAIALDRETKLHARNGTRVDQCSNELCQALAALHEAEKETR